MGGLCESRRGFGYKTQSPVVFIFILNSQRDRYKTGLDKIQETNVVIDEMQATLTELEPELKEKSAATEALMIKLDKDRGLR